MKGKLKIKGSMALAMKLGSVLAATGRKAKL
jgi:putative sterol carrier protein